MSAPLGRDVAAGLLEDPQALKAKILAVRARRSGERSFAAFVKQAWSYVPQVEPLVWGWHMDAICIHLEAVARAEINWLGIAMPPGFGKSVFTSVLWPAWIWTWWPRCQFIFGSYSHGFVVRDARRCREVVMSDWYQQTYCRPAGWALREDYGSADNFSNTAGGVRFATSVGGQGAGLRAHVIGVDDPLNIGDAFSDKARDEAIAWISQTLSQRFVAGYPPRFSLVMQRLHELDPMNWLSEQPGAQILRLPTEAEPESRCTTRRTVTHTNGHVERTIVEWADPRETPGELLFPALYPKERIEGDKLRLGSFGFAAQHQQRPAPEGGGLFPIKNWKFWTSDDATMQRLGYGGHPRPRGCNELPAVVVDLNDFDDELFSVDATFKETKSGSYVVIQVWASKGAMRLLLYSFRRRMDFTDTVEALLDAIKLFPHVRRKLIEGKANGDAIISTLEKHHGIIGLEAVPVGAAKKPRAMAMQPYQSAGNIYLPEGAPFVHEHIAEHAAFPNGANDDQVDCQSQGLQGLEEGLSGMDLWERMDDPLYG